MKKLSWAHLRLYAVADCLAAEQVLGSFRPVFEGWPNNGVATVADINSDFPAPSRLLKPEDTREGLLIIEGMQQISASKGFRVLLVGKQALASISRVTTVICAGIEQLTFKRGEEYFWKYLPANNASSHLKRWSATIVQAVREAKDEVDNLAVLDQALHLAILCLPQEDSKQKCLSAWVLRGVLAEKANGKQGIADMASRYQLGEPHFSTEQFTALVQIERDAAV